MHWHQSFNLSPSPLAFSLAQPCHWVHVSRQYLTDPGAQEEKRGEFTSIQLCFPPCLFKNRPNISFVYDLFCKCLQYDSLQQHAFLQFEPLLSEFDLCFPILTCYFFQNPILRMLRLGLGHKNNSVSKCFPLGIVVLSLNWFRWIPQIIEKRRRDRINHSLSELRRLVPSAFEKQVGPAQFWFRFSKQLSLMYKLLVLKLKLNCNKNQHLLPFWPGLL